MGNRITLSQVFALKAGPGSGRHPALSGTQEGVGAMESWVAIFVGEY